MKKIGFFAIHPGSSNALFPIISSLRDSKKHELYYYPLSEYASNLWCIDTHLPLNNFSLEQFIHKDLDILFYSAQSAMEVELEIPAFCKKHNIKSVSITDVIQITKSEILNRYTELPDFIISSTEELYTELCNENLDDCIILPFGNPYIEHFIDSNINNNLAIGKNLTVSFISAPNSNALMNDTAKTCEDIINELATYCRTHENIKKIYLCNHPRENLNFFNFFLTANADVAHLFEINPFGNTTSACFESDIIVGHNSSVLFEQALLGKKVIFHTDEKNLFSLLSKPNEIESKSISTPPNPLAHIISYFELK